MKNVFLAFLFLITCSSLNAQIDISTNIYDLLQGGFSLYGEKTVTKRTSLELGLIYRPLNLTLSENDTTKTPSWVFHKYKASSIITRINYKVYFSKRKYNLEGWYFSVFNRNIFAFNYDPAYKIKFIEISAPNSPITNSLTNFFNSLEIGLSLGFKRSLKNRMILFTSIGYSVEILEHIGYVPNPTGGINFNIVGSIGVGYRFNSKNKTAVDD